MARRRSRKSRRLKPMPAPDDRIDSVASTDASRPGRRVKSVRGDRLLSRADLWRRLWK
jgi:hypothetical protein